MLMNNREDDNYAIGCQVVSDADFLDACRAKSESGISFCAPNRVGGNRILPIFEGFLYWGFMFPRLRFLGRAGLTVLMAGVMLLASAGAKAAEHSPMKRLEKS